MTRDEFSEALVEFTVSSGVSPEDAALVMLAIVVTIAADRGGLPVSSRDALMAVASDAIHDAIVLAQGAR